MAKIDENNNLKNNFDKSSIAWFAIYIAIGLAISFAVPFPLSLLLYFGVFLLLQKYRLESIERRRSSDTLSKTNSNPKDRGLFDGIINSISNTLYGDPYGSFGYRPLRFCCTNCGREHKKRSCPVCGSMAVRAE